jgi:uncharacterized Ntn-hydrolase superfamily protein
MTYSIVARDPETGDMGVAVQSHYFSVGPVVPWALAGVGVVATQAMAEVSYGPLGLELMRGGKPAPAALRALLEADDGRAVRQVAMLDAAGGVAAHTGERCIPHAGHRSGDGVSVQANMMERDTVPDAMLAAFSSATGSLAERLVDALDAAEAEGGDIRGRQSAAILVVGGDRSSPWWVQRRVDLRVEDHPQPLEELRRLLRLRQAYDAQSRAFELMRSDPAAAAALMREALDRAPESDELAFWAALGLAASDLAEARRLLGFARDREPRWAELLRRLPATGTFPLTDEAVDALLSSGRRGGGVRARREVD